VGLLRIGGKILFLMVVYVRGLFVGNKHRSGSDQDVSLMDCLSIPNGGGPFGASDIDGEAGHVRPDQ
jgi:hypothetical protein